MWQTYKKAMAGFYSRTMEIMLHKHIARDEIHEGALPIALRNTTQLLQLLLIVPVSWLCMALTLVVIAFAPVVLFFVVLIATLTKSLRG